MSTIAIDLGGHTISFAEIETGRQEPLILRRIVSETPKERTVPIVSRALIRGITELAHEEHELKIGIGMPGFLNKARNKTQKLTNFTGFEEVPFPSLLSEELAKININAKVLMENDANCAALGEGLCGAAKGSSDFVVLTLGSGIGGGIISGGRLITGAHGMAAECGHIAVSENRKKCACGGIGHAESFASADNAEAEAKKLGLPPDFEILWQNRDNTDIQKILTPVIDSIAKTAAAIMVIFDPEITILNGGMSKADGIIPIIESAAKKYLPTPFLPHLKIERSKLEADAPLYGAASLFEKE